MRKIGEVVDAHVQYEVERAASIARAIGILEGAFLCLWLLQLKEASRKRKENDGETTDRNS